MDSHSLYSLEERAGSSVWYERSIRNRKVAGPNPAQSTVMLTNGVAGKNQLNKYQGILEVLLASYIA